MFDPNAYDDTYETCHETSAAFRLWYVALDPSDISRHLGLTPSWAYRRGDPRSSPAGTPLSPYKVGLWGLTSQGTVLSRDLRRHVDWLLDLLEPHEVLLHSWQAQGYRTDVFCHWVRLGGTGGPTLSPRNMARLARLNLPLGFEWWSVDEEEIEEEPD